MGESVHSRMAEPKTVRSEWISLLFASVIAICVFYVDTFTDIESAIATLYVITLLLSAELLATRGIVNLTAACVSLAVISYFVSHGLERDLPAALRLVVAVAALVITAVLISRNHRARLELIHYNSALQNSETRYRSIFEQSRVALWERDYTRLRQYFLQLKAQGVTDLKDYARDHPEFIPACIDMIPTVAANQAAMDLLGLGSMSNVTRAHTISMQRFISHNDMTFRDLMSAVFNGERQFEGKGSIYAEDGTTKMVLVTIGFPEDPESYDRVVVGMIDITDREMAQKALLDAHAELALASRAATAGALSASLAHELNQPLGAIVVNAQTLQRWLNREPPDVGAASRSAERIVRDSQRASEIIHNTRAILSQQEPTLELVSVPDLVLETKSMLENELERHEIEFSMEVAETVVPVSAVRVELQQVVINLITNAIQAIGEVADGRREIHVDISPGDDGMMSIRVRDTGPGMTDEVMEKLFKPFHSSKDTGLGMGLAICRTMMEARGGALTARNHPDGGAEFVITIPIEANDE